ncbi:hypothetical protein V2H45_19175 [Tumidithrix elongata RA019]|uniref:Uncharacterized protein n=1 Tax=Tumidithrix elongata BACA0141 TaxID=2716417 RepID=A0AAW9Q601_9CYAN|nr:hypothetical protein [Tumidithrix elongata RA019]
MAPIFRPEFNHFQTITATQAWSLFLSACKHDRLLGSNPMTGKYYTVGLLSAAIACVLEIIVSLPV